MRRSLRPRKNRSDRLMAPTLHSDVFVIITKAKIMDRKVLEAFKDSQGIVTRWSLSCKLPYNFLMNTMSLIATYLHFGVTRNKIMKEAFEG